MVDLLVLGELGIDLGLQSRAAPQHRPVLAVFGRYVSKAVVFKGVPDNFDVTVKEFEVVTSVCRLVRPNLNRVFVCSKH